MRGSPDRSWSSRSRSSGCSPRSAGRSAACWRSSACAARSGGPSWCERSGSGARGPAPQAGVRCCAEDVDRWSPMRTPLARLLLLAALAVGRSADAASAAQEATRWSFGPFAFEGAPVVAGERVLAAGRDPTGRRALIVLDAASGRLLSRTLLAADRPLALSAAGERVAVRASAKRVDLYRMRGGRLF